MNNVTRYQNAALQYYQDLTGSSHLHYGYWQPVPETEDDLTMAKLRHAQEQYTDHLLSFLPQNIETVLDVGCGNGDNASQLIGKGLQVEGIAPDPFQESNFLQKTAGKARFNSNTFQGFIEDLQRISSAPKYDLLLFSESTQYMASDTIANGAKFLVKPGGYVLLADMFRKNAQYQTGMFSNCLIKDELQMVMEKAGFILLDSDDISQQIVPTLDLCVQSFQTFGVSTLTYLASLVRIAVPPLYKIFDYFLGKQTKALVQEGLQAGNIFRDHLCYEIQLWQKLA
ncbi:methyltransferase domain-containing protein [Synechocystis sp. LEGE 06083]|uniref:class I SAM-dependent methyltransferase n=1 Tax=Synechocystis sp. LEGE 06083 TaxID=915336 RepID=UPI00187FF1FF|nr:methyltransferase domain-containing protein [Synechocystis sp. LEGE 06083]MBE9194545.1 methyltransferase domain-containing protein [Synechocystis sp. LEGE 06083]